MVDRRVLALKGGEPAVSGIAPIRWPVLGQDAKDAVLRVIERGVLSGPFAPEVRALEKEWASYVGTKHCLATNSGTAALHVALAAAGVGPGDEVVTSAFTFVATALAVLHQNAVPVFVDIEPVTYGLDPKKLEAAITSRTKAILPVHIHGTPCRIDEIAAIARARGITLIEDAAQAHGATHHKKKVGSIGAMGCFSVQSSKNLGAGEGGLFVTDDDSLWERANRTRMFGEDMRASDESGYRIERALDGNRAYDSMTMGWMYRTTELTSAVARTQLRTLDEMNDNARKNAELLNRRLRELPGVTPQVVLEGDTSCYHKYRVRFDATKLGIDAPPRRVRDALLAALMAEGVDAVLWQTKPVPGQRLFKEKLGYGKGCPWDHAAKVDYDLAQYPETQKLLDSSVVLFSQTYPIAPQPRALAEAYAEAFGKVWTRLDEVLQAVPAIPS
jgi:dTDP-4-amino-4,6-dideoxygalactose transaminase